MSRHPPPVALAYQPTAFCPIFLLDTLSFLKREKLEDCRGVSRCFNSLVVDAKKSGRLPVRRYFTDFYFYLVSCVGEVLLAGLIAVLPTGPGGRRGAVGRQPCRLEDGLD